MKHTERLNGVKEELCRVLYRADEILQLEGIELTVSEGLRTKGRQQQMFEQGKSKTLNSKHLTGDAADVYPLTEDKKQIRWNAFTRVGEAVKQAAEELEIAITWGGDWKFRDCPHIELKKTI